MKHKARECVWAPGMQETDITFTGEHTWAEITRTRKAGAREEAPGAPKGLFMVLGLGAIAMAVGAWLLY